MPTVDDIKFIMRWAQKNGRSSEEVSLYVSNLTPKSTQSSLRQWMESRGCMDGCDYLHVPRNFQTGECLGFAFLNFVDLPSAQKFKWSLQGTGMKAAFSTLQGLADNLAKWLRTRSSHVRDPENLPFVRALGARGLVRPAWGGQGGRGPVAARVPLPSFRGAAGGPRSQRRGAPAGEPPALPRAGSAGGLAEEGAPRRLRRAVVLQRFCV